MLAQGRLTPSVAGRETSNMKRAWIRSLGIASAVAVSISIAGRTMGATVAPPKAATDAPVLSPSFADSLRASIEDERRDADDFYRTSPQSPLAAVARADFKKDGGWLTIGSAASCDLVLKDPMVLPLHARVRVAGEGFRVEAIPNGATVRVNGRDTTAADTAPTWLPFGRYRVRLSYQNAPALIACETGRAEQANFAGLDWWPVDFAYRFVTALEPEAHSDTIFVESTNGPPRAAERAGRFAFRIGGKMQRLAAYRLLEPGVAKNSVSVFFRDGTSGKGSYGMGRYVDAEKLPDGRYVLDFNRATNPYCAYTPYFNCPIPPKENRLAVDIPAGQAYSGVEHETAGSPHDAAAAKEGAK